MCTRISIYLELFALAGGGGDLFWSLRGARKGDVAISAREWRRLLRFARNDIKEQADGSPLQFFETGMERVDTRFGPYDSLYNWAAQIYFWDTLFFF